MREGTEPSRFAFHNKKTAVHVSVIISASEITDNITYLGSNGVHGAAVLLPV